LTFVDDDLINENAVLAGVLGGAAFAGGGFGAGGFLGVLADGGDFSGAGVG